MLELWRVAWQKPLGTDRLIEGCGLSTGLEALSPEKLDPSDDSDELISGFIIILIEVCRSGSSSSGGLELCVEEVANPFNPDLWMLRQCSIEAYFAVSAYGMRALELK